MEKNIRRAASAFPNFLTTEQDRAPFRVFSVVNSWVVRSRPRLSTSCLAFNWDFASSSSFIYSYSGSCWCSLFGLQDCCCIRKKAKKVFLYLILIMGFRNFDKLLKNGKKVTFCLLQSFCFWLLFLKKLKCWPLCSLL